MIQYWPPQFQIGGEEGEVVIQEVTEVLQEITFEVDDEECTLEEF